MQQLKNTSDVGFFLCSSPNHSSSVFFFHFCFPLTVFWKHLTRKSLSTSIMEKLVVVFNHQGLSMKVPLKMQRTYCFFKDFFFHYFYYCCYYTPTPLHFFRALGCSKTHDNWHARQNTQNLQNSVVIELGHGQWAP